MKRLSTLAYTIIAALSITSCDMNKGGDTPPVVHSPFISAVFDYSPAPGQFVNKMPIYSIGANKEQMAKEAARSIVGLKNGTLITLGGFGGSVTFGFDHTIENKVGLRDFRIMGNAFNTSPDPNIEGGSAEPGVIYVSFDANQNALPDDTWYEIAGSEYKNSASMLDYQVTYHRPSSEDISDNYIKWDDNKSKSGYIAKLQYNMQSYYPSWISDATLSFNGVCLPNNAVDAYGDGALWILKPYGHGYADNAPNSHKDSAIDINWAVNADGTPANLKGINFVKVVSAINQQCGQIGETSTEIAGAYDLHLAQETVLSE